MSEQDFLTLVKSAGNYGGEGEASRAANAVFGSIKSRLSPLDEDRIRRALPKDASQLWQYCPAAHDMGGLRKGPAESRVRRRYLIFKIQQLGSYRTAKEAQRAACSVLAALMKAIPEDPLSFMGKVFPPEVLSACRLSAVRTAA